jgi:hypothetical protein
MHGNADLRDVVRPLALRSAALLFGALFFAVSVQSFGQETVIEGVTYAQPRVHPAEFRGDLSKLPSFATSNFPRQGKPYRSRLQGPPSTKFGKAAPSAPSAPQSFGGPRPPMPPSTDFAGLSSDDFCNSLSPGGPCGAGWPPDPNGDVGPNHYVEAVNDAIAIYDKSGTLLAAFTEDSLWSGVGTPCDGNSFGDPVVAYDWLADRFVLSWFAFALDFNGNPASPFYQCIAASKTSDPVAGGWWLYPIRTDPGGSGLPPTNDLNDYTKIGLWHDCLYMSANLFAFDKRHNGTYDGVLFGSFSRSDMYNGQPLTYSLGRLGTAGSPFTLIPSNNQGTGVNAAQPGTPDYFVSESGVAFTFEVRTFTAGPNCGAGGTLSAPTNVSQAAYTFQQGAIVPQPNTATRLDMIDDRLMQKVQYRNLGGAESLWVTHPVGTASGTIGMQWAQLDVTGGVIGANPVQQQIHAPDATLNRFMGSLAVDRQGNMALGYTTSNGTAPNFPSIAYAGRLVGDPPNTLPQTEVQMIAGSGSQENNCGGAPCDRWGDYSAMSLDPADSCTFWYINEYYSSQSNGNTGNWQTRIGYFKFPSCVGLPPTTTSVSSSLNPSNLNDLVTFTATVSGGSSPTGTIKFTSDGGTIGGCAAIALASGQAQCPTSSLSAGTHSIVATYSGDPGNASSSGILSPPQVVIGPATTTITLASSLNPAKRNMNVTFTATVTATNPTGSVGFTSNGTTINGCGSVALSGSGNTKNALCTTSFAVVGTYNIVASYGGDGTNPAATSSPLPEKIRKR